MTGGSVAYYAFPDDGGATLLRTISRLPAAMRMAMTWQPTQDWLLEVPPPRSLSMAAVFARLGVRRLDPTMQCGRFLVPEDALAAIQASLAKRPNVPVAWSRIEGVEFADARSRRAFEAEL